MSFLSGPGVGRAHTLARGGVGEQSPIVCQATPGQTGDHHQWIDANGVKTNRVDVAGHVYAAGNAAPTATAGANAGSSPPAPVVGGSASDMRGNVTFGTGTAPGAGAQVGVTFANPFSAAPVVMVVPKNTATQALGLYISAVTASGFTVSGTTAPAASQGAGVYSFDFLVLG